MNPPLALGTLALNGNDIGSLAALDQVPAPTRDVPRPVAPVIRAKRMEALPCQHGLLADHTTPLPLKFEYILSLGHILLDWLVVQRQGVYPPRLRSSCLTLHVP